MLYDSLPHKLLALPDASLVYPAHGAGSLCGKALSKETVSTIGEQRRVNYALQPMSQERVRRPRHGRSAGCAAVLHLRRRAEQQGAADARCGAGAERQPLSLDQRAGATQRSGAQMLDTRDPVGVRRRASGRQHQHRSRRPVRDVGRNGPQSRSSDRDHRGPWPRERIGDSPRPHRLRSRRRVSRRTACAASIGAARPDGHDRTLSPPPLAAETSGGGRRGGRRRPRRRSSATRSQSPEVSASALTSITGLGSAICPRIVRSGLLRRRAIARRSPQAAAPTMVFKDVSEIAGGFAAWETAHLPLHALNTPRLSVLQSSSFPIHESFRHSWEKFALASLWHLPDGTTCLLLKDPRPRTGRFAS